MSEDMNGDMNGELEPRVGRTELEDIQMQSNQVTDEVSSIVCYFTFSLSNYVHREVGLQK